MVTAKRVPELTETRVRNFWNKVDIKGPDDCWIWKGCCDTRGYGQLSFSRREGAYRAHRVALIISGVEDVQNMDVCHSCNNRLCVNPSHLRYGTRLDNMRDKESHGTKLLGSKTAKAKLTEADIPVIRSLCKTRSRKAIAEVYGVTPATISAVSTGRYWAHVL